jgi:hypothetical protein
MSLYQNRRDLAERIGVEPETLRWLGPKEKPESGRPPNEADAQRARRIRGRAGGYARRTLQRPRRRATTAPPGNARPSARREADRGCPFKGGWSFRRDWPPRPTGNETREGETLSSRPRSRSAARPVVTHDKIAPRSPVTTEFVPIAPAGRNGRRPVPERLLSTTGESGPFPTYSLTNCGRYTRDRCAAKACNWRAKCGKR